MTEHSINTNGRWLMESGASRLNKADTTGASYARSDLGKFLSISFIYASGLILASVTRMADGHLVFTYAHVFFCLSFLAIFALDKNFRVNLVIPVFRDYSALSIALFILYYALMTLIHPDKEVSAYHLYSLVVPVGVGFCVGFTAFALGNANSPYTFPLAIRYLNIVSIFIYILIITYAFYRFTPIIRKDFFLVELPTNRIMYQLFGVYMLFGVICFISSTWIYFLYRRDSILFGALWMAALCSAALASFFLVQLAGSSLGAGICAAIGASAGVSIILMSLHKRSFARAAAMAAVGFVAAGIFAAVVINSPPLRIFGFKPVVTSTAVKSPDIQRKQLPAEGKQRPPAQRQSALKEPRKPADKPKQPDQSPSIHLPSIDSEGFDSRFSILGKEWYQQFAYAPLLGDLGVDRVKGRSGDYIHSLISVQPHLGAVGTLLLSIFLLVRLYRLYRRDGNFVLKLIAPWLLAAGLIGTFFTWMPFWFLLGGLYAATPKNDPRM